MMTSPFRLTSPMLSFSEPEVEELSKYSHQHTSDTVILSSEEEPENERDSQIGDLSASVISGVGGDASFW